MSQVLRSRWPKYWSFSFNISSSNEYSGLISFRMDWLDLLAVLGTLKSLLQHHSSKASILKPSAFFIVQLSHPYMLLLLQLSHVSRVRLCVTHRRQPTRLPRPWDSPGKNTGVGCHLQGIFPTQGSNPGLRHCRQMLYPLSHQGSESWTIKKAEHQRIDAFKLWCWRRL